MSICERLVQGLSDYFVLLSSVRDDLVTDDGNQVLSARQGMVLKNLVDSKVPVIVESASVKVCTEDDDPVAGYVVGDRYVDFELNTGDEDHIYILCSEIIRVITSYNDLTNLPSVNGVTLSGDKSTSDLLVSYDDLSDKPLIPAKVSDLVNDSGFITNSYHDSSKQNTLTAGSNITIVNDVISASSSTQIQSDYAQTDSTQVDYIKNKPDIRALVIDVLNEKFDGMISNATVENGKLKVNRFNSGDFDDE